LKNLSLLQDNIDVCLYCAYAPCASICNEKQISQQRIDIQSVRAQ